MDQRQIINLFFSGNKAFKKVYLQPPTSQRNLPPGINELDKYLENKKVQKDSKAQNISVLREN